MKGNAKDYVSTAQQFFTAYDAHDVDGMLGLCADGALGRYAPYGRESVVPIRGGIDVIWRAFPNAVPNFRVKVIELIPTDGNTVVIQAEMSGPIPAEEQPEMLALASFQNSRVAVTTWRFAPRG